jgi:alanine dehydrogenase
MRIGVPTEIKNHEYRVGLTPAAVRELVHARPRGGGADPGRQRHRLRPMPTTWPPAHHRRRLPPVFAKAEMIVKVKEPQPQECAMLRRARPVHLPAPRAGPGRRPRGLAKSGCTAIAYETITDDAAAACRCWRR